MEWIHLAEDTDNWMVMVVVNTVKNIPAYTKYRVFLAFFPFILVFTLGYVFGLFYLCLVTHLLNKHVEISTLCARYSLQ